MVAKKVTTFKYFYFLTVSKSLSSLSQVFAFVELHDAPKEQKQNTLIGLVNTM